MKGLSKLDLDETALQQDLDNNPELLAEPFPIAMRVFGEENPYERLKASTRGKKIDKKALETLVDSRYEFLSGEVRFAALEKSFPEESRRLRKKIEQEVMDR